MARRYARSVLAAVVTVVVATACTGGTVGDAEPSGQAGASSAQATATSAAPVFDPPKAFAEDGVRVTRDHGALVGPELAYTPTSDDEENTDPTLTVRAISLADGEERWSVQTPVQRPGGLRGRNGFLRLTEGPGPLRLVWAGVQLLPGSGTQQDRYELVVGAIDAEAGRQNWSVRMPLTQDVSPEDAEVTVVGADDAHVVVTVASAGGTNLGAIADVRAGKLAATPADFVPVGLDGQTVVGRLITGSLGGGVAQGRDIATGQPRWTSETKVDDLRAAVVTAGLAQFVEDAVFDSKTLLVSTADGALRATLPGSRDCSAAADDVVVCAGFDQVTALDLAGKPLWSLPDEAAGRLKPAVTAVHAGLVYAQANGGVILDARTGRDLVTDLEWVPDEVVRGYGIGRDEVDGLTSRRATA